MKSIINIPQSQVDLFCGTAGVTEFIYKDHQHLINASKPEGSRLIFNCHTFTKYPLPNELDQRVSGRPHIIIGADIDHTPKFLVDVAMELFEGVGLKAVLNPAINSAQKSCETDIIVSIGVQQELYLTNSGGRKSDFALVKWKVKSVIDRLVILGNAGLLH